MKDPAFLFYTKDFQAGTQDFSCEEVGAYLRLLMYQHQHGFIPNDKERMMRITSIFSEQKFDLIWGRISKKFNQMVNQNSNHLYNQRMNQEMNKRVENKPKKIAAATLAGLISGNNLNKTQKNKIKKDFKIEDFIYDKNNNINDLELIKSNIKEWFLEMVNQMVNNKGNANANANGNNNIKKVEEFLEPISEKWKDIIQEWLLYKSARSENYKTKQSVLKFETKLKKLSAENLATARQIIDQSMANNWAGIFELKVGSKSSTHPFTNFKNDVVYEEF